MSDIVVVVVVGLCGFVVAVVVGFDEAGVGEWPRPQCSLLGRRH